MITLPGAVPVTTARHGSPEWHEARKRGIGGSDAAALLGTSQYTTARQLWELKTGRREGDAGNAYTRCGQLLEDAILERTYYGHATRGVLYGSMRSLERPHMLANIDGTYSGRLVEIKTTGRAWHKVPEHYVAQVRHYLYVCGLDAADVVECHVQYDRPALVAAMEQCGLRPDRVVEKLCHLTMWEVRQDAAWLESYLTAADEFWRAVEADQWTQEDAPF